jgi:hypothetical protein
MQVQVLHHALSRREGLEDREHRAQVVQQTIPAVWRLRGSVMTPCWRCVVSFL